MSAPPRPRHAAAAADAADAGDRPGGPTPPDSATLAAWADPADALPADVEEALTLEARLVVVEAMLAMTTALALQQTADPAAELRRWSDILATIDRSPETPRGDLGGLILERYKAKVVGGFDALIGHVRTLVDAFLANPPAERRRRR